jgi:hypothetical protein
MIMEVTKTFSNGMTWSGTSQVNGGGIVVPVNDLALLPDSEAIVMIRSMVETAQCAIACEDADRILRATHGQQWHLSVLQCLDELVDANLLYKFVDQDESIGKAVSLIAEAIAIRQEKEKGKRTTKQTRRDAKARYDSLFVDVGRRDGFLCAVCGHAGNDLQLDHIIPVAKGGTNDLGNLQLLCPPCNLAKSDQ